MGETLLAREIPVSFSSQSVDNDYVMSALKKENSRPGSEEEFEFDVGNDWRKSSDSTQTNIFKADDLEIAEDELDTSSLALDLDGEITKKNARENTKEQTKILRTKKASKKDTEDTLKVLQEAATGEGGGKGAEDIDDEMEILTEEDKALVNDPIFSNKGHDYPQIHGNYFLLDHLVDGGMAKVCRARYLGEGDEADKMVAIKMVQEKYSEDEDFVQMFIDEIKVSFGLNHPNINTTFDYGKIGKNLFVSMEYIHGKDLMDVVDELKEQGRTLPISMCIFIASKMCEALHYAHNFTNKLTGKKYNIVHRDISPHNAMISYEGYVKVIDFGIAKADTNSQKEEEGTVKGKINYFAPEYLEGKQIDHRYDQFAVALTLWEMLTGEKTFTGDDQMATLRTILKCEPSLPSSKNKEVPKALDKIIMKALSRDPENRYKDMQDFNRNLVRILYQLYPDFHESDIATLMTTTFEKSYNKDIERFKEFGQYSLGDIVQKIAAYKEFQNKQKEQASRQGAKGRAADAVFDFGFEEESISARGGKGGIDSLVARRRKPKKPGLSPAKNIRKDQRALAAMLKDDVGHSSKRGSFLKENRALVFIISFIALGVFQKEKILGLIIDQSEPTLQVSKNDESEEDFTEAGVTRENSNFLKKLKKVTKKEVKVVERRPAKVEEAVERRPAKVEEAVEQRPAKVEEAVERRPAKVEEAVEQRPAKVEEAVEQRPAKVEEAVERRPVKVEEAVEQRPAKVEEAVEQKAGDQVPVEEEFDDTAAELAKLKAQMSALLDKDKEDTEVAPEVKPAAEQKLKQEQVEVKEEAKALEIKRSLASKLDELEREESEESLDDSRESGQSTLDNVVDFIKSRRAFSWMFN